VQKQQNRQASKYTYNPSGVDVTYFILMSVALYSFVTNIQAVTKAVQSNSNKLIIIPKAVWTLFYGVFLLHYGIPTTEEKNNVFINVVKGSSIAFAVLYGLLSIIIPLVIISDFIPVLNAITLPLTYVLDVALLVL
jgi:hypothetical protein